MKKFISKQNIKNTNKNVSRSTSNGMKKTFLSILIIISFFSLFSFLNITKKVEASDSWYFIKYKNSTPEQRSSIFPSSDACELGIVAFINSAEFNNRLNKTLFPGDCIKETTDPVGVTGQKDASTTGGWFYEDLNTKTRSSSFNSSSNCEEYRTDNKLTASTTDCYSVYKLLAPIGDFKEAPKNIGDYFNTIFLLAIGLCGALAVVMIVIGGVQYMGDESIFGKTEAKSKITSAIFGLLIALGSYALLNTVNPDLLGGKGIKINSVSAEIEDTPLVMESTPPATGIAVGQCSGGLAPVIVGGSTIMNTCVSISSQVTSLITKASQSGISISGKSYRSNADQVALRNQNCADPINTPSNKCKPPTAKAGNSLHESGLAIDFKCSGEYIQTTDNVCFLWLQSNASNYGLQNLIGGSEPWHWSTTGH
jgi:hypothetical protein